MAPFWRQIASVAATVFWPDGTPLIRTYARMSLIGDIHSISRASECLKVEVGCGGKTSPVCARGCGNSAVERHKASYGQQEMEDGTSQEECGGNPQEEDAEN